MTNTRIERLQVELQVSLCQQAEDVDTITGLRDRVHELEAWAKTFPGKQPEECNGTGWSDIVGSSPPACLPCPGCQNCLKQAGLNREEVIKELKGLHNTLIVVGRPAEAKLMKWAALLIGDSIENCKRLEGEMCLAQDLEGQIHLMDKRLEEYGFACTRISECGCDHFDRQKDNFCYEQADRDEGDWCESCMATMAVSRDKQAAESGKQQGAFPPKEGDHA